MVCYLYGIHNYFAQIEEMLKRTSSILLEAFLLRGDRYDDLYYLAISFK